MSNQQSVKMVLEFPEGLFLIPNNGGIYFMPDADSDKAYLGYGEKKELHGKFAHKLPTRSDAFEKYDVTYEVEDGDLLAARLITPFSRSAGKFLDEASTKKIEAKLQDGSLTLVNRSDAPRIIRAAKAGDGTMAVLVESHEGPTGSLERTLYGGTEGNLEPLTNSYVQGGNSFYFSLDDGTRVELPYSLGGPRHDEPPKYGDKLMAYLNVEDSEDLAAFGIEKDAPDPHLDPFCPELGNTPQP